MGPAMVGRAIVPETMMVKARGQEDRATDKPRPIEPGVPPVGWLGIRIRIDRLWRQRVNLLRQAGRVQRNLPTAIGLLARLTGGLLLLSFNHDLHGELAASPEGHLRRGECSIGRARGNRADTARQEQRQRGTQKGMRTSISGMRRRDLVVLTPFSTPAVRTSMAPNGVPVSAGCRGFPRSPSRR